ncbi:MAG: flagellar hook-associated protein FlgK [Firmicutes bacterium]|nr:flagellar hook-associated protein FlgK [[Eubacterium] siraeum]MCM1488427.1 flagellar hook-associated protein FlgK [Bacillota bacterium]
MRSTFLGLEVSKRTIQIAQKALDTTNTNLSNVNTEGYSRQRLDLNAQYISVSGKYSTHLARLTLAGQGVNAFGVSQIRDTYLDKRYREFTAYCRENEIKQSVLKEAEKILSSTDNVGLLSNLQDFKDALSKYAGDSPYNKEYASICRNEASSICQTLRTLSTDLDNLTKENVIALQDAVSSVNDIIDKIATYNGVITGEYNITAADKIYKDESVIGSYGPNELMDQRNNLLDELSQYGNIKVYDNNDGSVKVYMGNTVIIDGTKSEQVVMKDYYTYGAAVLKFSNGEIIDSSTVTSGEIVARMDMLNGNGTYAAGYQNTAYGIPYYQSTLDSFAQAFAEKMNELNGMYLGKGNTGDSRVMFACDADYDADGNRIVKTDEDGNPVYDADGNVQYRDRVTIDAHNIRISEEWMNDATMIGQVYKPELDADGNDIGGTWDSVNLDGNAVNALLLGISEDKVEIGRAREFTGTIYDYYNFITNRIAESISYYGEQLTLNTNNVNTIGDNRQSIMGVSDTEEGINMMTYQKWFNASSRMMTTLDEMIDKIVNSTGIVGR